MQNLLYSTKYTITLLLTILSLATTGALAQPAGFFPVDWSTAGVVSACSAGTQTYTVTHTQAQAYTNASGPFQADGDLQVYQGPTTIGDVVFSSLGGLVHSRAGTRGHGVADGEGWILSVVGSTITVSINDAAAVTGSGNGTASAGIELSAAWGVSSKLVTSTMETVGPVTAFTGSVYTSNVWLDAGFDYLPVDCDEDGEAAAPYGADPDDTDACVISTQAASTSVGSGTLVKLMTTANGLAGGGSLGELDCDADGTLASADSDDYDACVNPAYNSAINAPGATADDCDGDGDTNTAGDPDDSNPCDLIASSAFASGTTPDCDGDGTSSPADTDDFDMCVNPAYDTAINIPGGTGGDCDNDGTAGAADGDDADSCVDPTTAPGTNDCDADGTTVAAGDGDDTDNCVNHLRPRHQHPWWNV